MNHSIRVVGMVWYSAQDFDEIKAMMKDGHKLHRTYAEWQQAAEQGERTLGGQGNLVVRAHLVPDAFCEYCRVHGLDLDAHGRNHFANWVARQAHGETH